MVREERTFEAGSEGEKGRGWQWQTMVVEGVRVSWVQASRSPCLLFALFAAQCSLFLSTLQ